MNIPGLVKKDNFTTSATLPAAVNPLKLYRLPEQCAMTTQDRFCRQSCRRRKSALLVREGELYINTIGSLYLTVRTSRMLKILPQ